MQHEIAGCFITTHGREWCYSVQTKYPNVACKLDKCFYEEQNSTSLMPHSSASLTLHAGKNGRYKIVMLDHYQDWQPTDVMALRWWRSESMSE